MAKIFISYHNKTISSAMMGFDGGYTSPTGHYVIENGRGSRLAKRRGRLSRVFSNNMNRRTRVTVLMWEVQNFRVKSE